MNACSGVRVCLMGGRLGLLFTGSALAVGHCCLRAGAVHVGVLLVVRARAVVLGGVVGAEAFSAVGRFVDEGSTMDLVQGEEVSSFGRKRKVATATEREPDVGHLEAGVPSVRGSWVHGNANGELSVHKLHVDADLVIHLQGAALGELGIGAVSVRVPLFGAVGYVCVQIRDASGAGVGKGIDDDAEALKGVCDAHGGAE